MVSSRIRCPASFPSTATATVTLDTLPGWKVAPASQPATFSREDEAVTVRFVATPGARVTLPTTTTAPQDRRATATPSSGLGQGSVVTVQWSGFTPGGSFWSGRARITRSLPIASKPVRL